MSTPPGGTSLLVDRPGQPNVLPTQPQKIVTDIGTFVCLLTNGFLAYFCRLLVQKLEKVALVLYTKVLGKLISTRCLCLKGLHQETAGFVAIKQIQLSALPKEQLQNIMVT